MEKYATYNFYRNIDTGEVKRIPLHEVEDSLDNLTKTASTSWILITDDKEVTDENKKINF